MKPPVLKNLLIVAALLGMLASIMFAAFTYYLHRPLPLDDTTLIEVPAGSTLNAVARQLHQQGYLEFPAGFILWTRLNGLERQLKPGEYELQPGLTPDTLVGLLVSGKNKQYALTLVEGWTFRQALAAIGRQEKIRTTLVNPTDTELLALFEENDAVLSAIPFLEGSLLPETYFYTAGTRDLDILRRAHLALRQTLKAEWATRLGALPYDNPWQALILASIIEKESSINAEKAQIAGVFVRRLELGMRLQSDPTVIYGLGPEYAGVIRTSDLQSAHVWNTYRNNGLPPTPIALSSQQSLHASLNPAAGSSLYFVADGNGGHVFSDTLEAHNAAVQRYRQQRAAGSGQVSDSSVGNGH
ncbi:MAG: endolytic transglycosylase MltG [Pseudomonadales bacterium]|nr:endolytic transglycosylase MltG [Pseudomonadales bacterium]